MTAAAVLPDLPYYPKIYVIKVLKQTCCDRAGESEAHHRAGRCRERGDELTSEDLGFARATAVIMPREY